MKLPKGTELAIRKALKKSYSASEVKRILMRTQAQYNAFIREAPAPGGGDIHKRRPIRLRFSGTWLQKLAYAILRKYAVFTNRRVDSGQWKNTWKLAVNPENRENGISMPLINCPVAAFAKKHGYEHLMPLFCGSDFKVAERYGLRLIRRHTEAEGFPDCDFWYLMENDAER